MNARELISLGIPKSALPVAFAAMERAAADLMDRDEIRDTVRHLCHSPGAFVSGEVFGDLAQAVMQEQKNPACFQARQPSASSRIWGRDIEPESIRQMENACELPVAVRGALMPDAHLGYGLPIGGVLATQNAVIPYAVGMDIACRMKMTVLDLPVSSIENDFERLRNALQRETSFGVGARFKYRRQHAVMDEDWSVSKVTRDVRDKAWSQLGTSGSGNHFVEYGEITIDRDGLGLEPGTYLALLSHSGSRGAGGSVAQYYSRLAKKLHPELPRHLSALAWFSLDSSEGQEYWKAMQLMGAYAAANHELIHRHIAAHLGGEVLLDIENHHNFAWKEMHGGHEVIVHRKGATPAQKGVLGIIPGSMAAPAFVVRGRGNDESLHSASHGAGRRMSRKQAKKQFNWKHAREFLDAHNVTLLSAGLDEVPMAYKDIESVMEAQADLVESAAIFHPRIVRMAKGSERPED